MIISVDCGRQSVKAITGSRRKVIPSVVGEWRQRRISEGGDYEVSINGQQYFVGDLAATESRFRRQMANRSKIHEETKVLTLTAIALLSEGGPVRLVTGLPVEQHTPAVKTDLTRLLSGRHQVQVNGQRREIILADDDIAITIEGAGAYWAEVLGGTKAPGRCRVIDLGSRTINALTITGNRFADLDSCTLNYGCMELEACDNPGDALGEQLARRIFADLSRRWMDLRDDQVLLAGGGALLMEQWLMKHFPRARVLPDPVYANAVGYYKMGVARWQKSS